MVIEKIFSIFFILLFFFIIINSIYKNFYKPLNNYKDYIKRSVSYELLLQERKAIKIKKEGLKLENLAEHEKCLLLLSIGESYYTEKQFIQANIYFDSALEILLDTKFYYNKTLLNIIRSYLNCNQMQKAQELYKNFVNRQSYDSKFRHIQKLSKLFKD